MNVIRAVVQLLKDLRIQHTDEVIERRIVVRDHSKQRRSLLPERPDVQLVLRRQRPDLLQVERRQPHRQRDQDGLCGLARRLLVDLVLPHRDVPGLRALQRGKQHVQRRLIPGVLLSHIGILQHGHDHGEVLLLRRRFGQQIEQDRFQQRRLRLLPERIAGRSGSGRGVADQVGDQLEHVLLIPYVNQRIVPIRLREFHQIEHPDAIPPRLQQSAYVTQQLALRICQYIRGIALHQVGLGIEARLARAAAADDEHIEIAPVSAPIRTLRVSSTFSMPLCANRAFRSRASPQRADPCSTPGRSLGRVLSTAAATARYNNPNSAHILGHSAVQTKAKGASIVMESASRRPDNPDPCVGCANATASQSTGSNPAAQSMVRMSLSSFFIPHHLAS